MCVFVLFQQRQLTGQSIECMRPAGKVKLEKIETGIFQEQLKQQTPRQVDLNFEALISKFHEKQRQHEEMLAREKDANEKRLAKHTFMYTGVHKVYNNNNL